MDVKGREFVTRQRQNMTAESQFDQRSDNAALKLKQDINRRFEGDPNFRPLAPSPVAVGPDGQPPAPPPPEGSYMRQAWDQQQAQLRAEQAAAAQQAQHNMGQPTQQQVVGDQPPAGTPEQQADGSVAPPLTSGQQQPAAPEGRQQDQSPVSENANARIQGLIADLREKDRLLAEEAARRIALEQEQAQVRTQMQQLQQEREQMMREHLDELDPETRATIMAEARFREMLADNNRQLMAALQPQLSTLQQQTQQTEYEKLARKYPGFDMQIHPTLIESVRAKNRELTVEMAFKAVAEGDEAVPRGQVAHAAVPPVTPPGNGSVLPRYMPEPQPDPTAELREFQRRTNELLRSEDPAQQRQGRRQLDDVLKARLEGSSYHGKPSVFD